MGKTTFTQTSFVSGELSPLVKGRTDLDQYYQGVENADNVLIVTQGGLKRRAGTQYVSTAPSILVNNSGNPTSTVVGQGTVGNLDDFNPATSMTTTEVGNIGTQGQPDFVVAKYDQFGGGPLFNDTFFVQVNNIRIANTNGTEYTGSQKALLRVQVSENGTIWSNLGGSFYVEATPKSFRLDVDNASTPLVTKFIRLVRTEEAVGDILTGLGIATGGFECLTSNIDPSAVKTFDFSVSITEHYLCVLTGGAEVSNPLGNMQIYKIIPDQIDYPVIASLQIPIKSSQVASVRSVQTENVMLLFQEDLVPLRIIRNSEGVSPWDWVVDEIPFLNVPQFDYNDAQSPTPVDYVTTLTFAGFDVGESYQVDVEGILSKNITYATDQSSTAFNLQKNLQEMPSFGDTGVEVLAQSATEFQITVSGESTKPFEAWTGFATGGPSSTPTMTFTIPGGSPTAVSRKEDVWSATRGYPKIGAFFGGRLWFGGTKSKNQSLFASRSGSFFDFFTEAGDDDEGIFITISSRKLTQIVDVNPDRGLQVFTNGSEFLVTGSTPSNIAVASQTQHGSLNLEVQSVDGATLFVDANGNTLRSYIYNFNEDAFISNDISVFNSQLIDQPKDMAILDGTTSEDANWVFIINQDGNASILNTLRSQDINGFTKWTNSPTNSIYPLILETVSVVNDELFVVYKRDSSFKAKRYVARWTFDQFFDVGLKITNKNMISADYKLYLTSKHLDGDTVNLVARGTNFTKRIVTSLGTSLQISTKTVYSYLQLTKDEADFILGNPTPFAVIDVAVGFNFAVTVKPMPLNTNATNIAGANQMRTKKVSRMNIRMFESAGVYVDGNPVPIREFGSAANSPLNNNLPIKSGIIENNNGGNGWGIDVVPIITVPDPTPFQMQAIEYQVESS